MEEDAAVEYIIIYIPVADATDGGTPILKSKGLKMAPPPRPKAPETHPPKKANMTSYITFLFSNLKSLSTIPLLYLSFNVYSFLTVYTDQ